MKNDSPLSTLRLSDFMKPPSAFDSISTPPEWAIIAPDSARHSSPGPSWARHTAKAGLCRTVISIDFLQGGRGHAAVAYDLTLRACADRQLAGCTLAWRFAEAARFSLSA